MVTVTTIFHHATPDLMKVDSYQCQKCGCTSVRQARAADAIMSPLTARRMATPHLARTKLGP
jgi:hypothetical protein